MISASFVPNLLPLPSFVQLYQKVGGLIIADNCNALGLIPLPAERSISVCLISYANYGGTCKFLICHFLLLSLDEELVDLSFPLAFSPYP